MKCDMKLFLLLLFLLAPDPLPAQKTTDWQRVYTFEESFIEMNTSNVILGGDIGRVTFRWRFDQPQQVRGYPGLNYKSRVETIEFRCADERYRYYEVTLIDPNGKPIHSQLMAPPYAWRQIKTDSVIASMSASACPIIKRQLDPEETNRVTEIEPGKEAKFAQSIKETLDRSGDFKPLIERFFVSDFIKRYLGDDETNWFYNLNRETAARASRAELQRFYVASLNAGYLTTLYLVSQTPRDDDSSPTEAVPPEQMIPADLRHLIDAHPYTLTYKAAADNYDYLAENIDSIARMRSYTDLLERIAALMRTHIKQTPPGGSRQSRDFGGDFDLPYRVCSDECLGLPQGTKVFELNMAPLHLEFAQVKGELKIISARDSSR